MTTLTEEALCTAAEMGRMDDLLKLLERKTPVNCVDRVSPLEILYPQKNALDSHRSLTDYYFLASME